MDFKYRILDNNEWNNIRANLSESSVFGNTEFLSAFSDSYKIRYELSCIFYKDDPIILLAYFVKGNNIVIPHHYYFQYLWLKNQDSEESWILLEGFSFLIKQLQKKYVNIDFRLPIDIKDVRPFIWNDFSVIIKYTYVKSLLNLGYHHNIKRILKKQNLNYSFKKNEDWPLVWEHHNKDFEAFGIRLRLRKKYLNYFEKMLRLGIIDTYNAYNNGVFISSIITITDKPGKKAYFPLIGTVDGHYKDGLAVKLYDYTLSELKSSGIDEVDLYGANMKSIARFKSKFNPELVQFYEVRYRKRCLSFKKIKEYIIRVVITIEKFFK